EQQLPAKRLEIRALDHVVAAERNGLVDQLDSLTRTAGQPGRPGSEREQERPEDRRRLEAAVEGDAALDAGVAVLGAAESARASPLQRERKRGPDRVGVARGPFLHGERALERPLVVRAPQIEKTDVEEGVGQCEGMVEPARELLGERRPLEGTVRTPEKPEQQPRGRVRGHTGARPEAKTTRRIAHGIEELDGAVEVLEAVLDPAHEGSRGPEQEMSFDLEARIVLLLGQVEQLAPHPCRFLELAPVEVEGGEAAEDREEPRHLPELLTELERADIRLLDLLRVATDRQQAPREAR